MAQAGEDCVRIRVVVIIVALAAGRLFAQETPLVTAGGAPLATAARANDFATFDALYQAKPVEAFRALHQLWTYSVTDPGGAFYGEEMYGRFARAYPTFPEVIAQERIVDSRGNVFYPSRETRAFLLAQAESGIVALQPLSPSVTPSRAVIEPESALSTPMAGAGTASRINAVAATVSSTAEEPVAEVPVPNPNAMVAALRISTPPVLPLAQSAPAPAAAAVPEQQDHTSGRGLLLLIIGLLGTGVLAMIVRTPREVSSIRNP